MKKHYRKTKNLFLLVIILQLFTNCDFEFSEDFYKEINQEAPNATISLNDFTDNKILHAPLNVLFKYEGINKHRLYEIRVYIDNVQIHYSSNNSGGFYIDSDNLTEGNHILKIEYIFSSGTGSLADVNNLEAYIQTDEYNFSIDKSAPVTVILTNVEVLDGTIYISWNPISNFNFDQAILIIKSDGIVIEEAQLSNELLSAQIFNDINSLSNNLSYTIKLKNRYKESLSNPISLTTEEILIEKVILNQNQYKLIWTKHPLYNNFDFYFLNISQNNTVELSPLGGNLIINKDPVFGTIEGYNDLINLDLYKYVDNENNYRNLHSISKYVPFGNQFDKKYCREYVYSSIADSYFGVEVNAQTPREVIIHQLDPHNLSTINSTYITTTSGNYADLTIDPITNNLIIDLKDKSFLLDSQNLSIINQWNSFDFIGNNNNLTMAYRNGMLIFTGTAEGVAFYNSNTKEKFYTTSIYYYFNLSDDGHYFYTNDGIYEVNNDLVSYVTSTDTGSSIHSIEFMLDQNKCIYSNINNSPVIFDFNTKTKTVLSIIDGVGDVRYDKKTQKILLGQYHTFPENRSFVNIYDLNNNSFKKLEVYSDHYNNFYRYLNGKLIFSAGSYLNHYLN